MLLKDFFEISLRTSYWFTILYLNEFPVFYLLDFKYLPSSLLQKIQLGMCGGGIRTLSNVSNGAFLLKIAQPTFQRRWSDVENETKSDIGFSTLHNVDTTSVSDVETTLKQRWYNFILTLLQRVLNISKSYIKTSWTSD